MANEFHPITMDQLTSWIFQELEQKNSIFGIPKQLFFTPKAKDRFCLTQYQHFLESPLGVAAGPHSQMAQNIIVAWLCGARFIELKTVQTMDQLQISRPCIDLEDEGYNVEWSQELKISESYEEYLRAWVLIHALHHKLRFPGQTPGIIFNLSVGYNMEGLLKPNMQWYLSKMTNAFPEKEEYVKTVAKYYPEITNIPIPNKICDSVTLSTMHGCPPNEIEKIASYLMQTWKFHTNVKLNPTLLGAEEIRRILNQCLGFEDIEVQDSSFEHDLKYSDAVSMIRRLLQLAQTLGLTFGLKLTNTLEVRNFRNIFDSKEKMMYMSGRSLHPISIHVALKLLEEFQGNILLSFSAGADCFNIHNLIACGLKTVTVCSDILKSGGYMRMLQYLENLQEQMNTIDAIDAKEYIVKIACQQEYFVRDCATMLQKNPQSNSSWYSNIAICEEFCLNLVKQIQHKRLSEILSDWATQHHLSLSGLEDNISHIVAICQVLNASKYAPSTLKNSHYYKQSILTSKSKTNRALGLFDCIKAPCQDECPISQKVPWYMEAVREGRFQDAIEIVREDNSIPTILGKVCDHLCEHTCIRTHYDNPLSIRAMKQFIMSQEKEPHYRPKLASLGVKIAIIGGGPGGITAAYFLSQAGYSVTIFEARGYLGGMVSGTIPSYRLPESAIFQDIKILENLGVEIRYHQRAGIDFQLQDLRNQGYLYTIVTIGAQQSKKLDVPGEESEGVIDALSFLRSVRENKPLPLGKNIGIIGAGDTAMDCARTAWRLMKDSSKVKIVYRRTISEMPADREEIVALLEEGIEIVQLTQPLSVVSENGKMTALRCQKMKLGQRDRSGRKKPEAIPGSEFDLPLDTLILAISQNSDAEFLAKEKATFNKKGYLEVNPETMETSLPNIYAGGDISQDGPASIVKACGDARKIVASIRQKQENIPAGKTQNLTVDMPELLQRRCHREKRIEVHNRPVSDRQNFKEVVPTLTTEQAQKEAQRCLDCHKLCSICASVCPNMAIMTYQNEPFSIKLPKIEIKQEKIEFGENQILEINQLYQIAIFADFCNQCGNCATFCPTAGKPYQDKPRIFLYKADFVEQSNNAFMIFKDSQTTWTIQGRFQNQLHNLIYQENLSLLTYQTPAFEIKLNSTNFQIMETTLLQNLAIDQSISLEPLATLWVLLKAMKKSMPHIPTAH